MARKKKIDPQAAARDALLVNAITPRIAEHPKYLEVDDECVEVLNFVDFKNENDVGWADAILSQRNVSFCCRLDPARPREIKEGIDMHERQTREGLLSARKTASQINDLERDARHGLEILDIMGDANEKFFMASISAVLHAPSAEELPMATQRFSAGVEAEGMAFKAIPWNHLTGFFAASPLRCPDPDGVEQSVRPMPAGTIAHMLYTKETGLDDGLGIDLGVDDMDGIVRVNMVERTESRHNSNVFIMGGSGAGKSTLAKLLALSEHLMYGSRVIIIDPEGEFSDLVRALGGDVVTVGAKSSSKISPLQPRALAGAEDEGGGDVDDEDAGSSQVLLSTIPFAKSFLQLAFGIPDEDMNLLEIALERAYEKYGIGPATTFREYRERNLSYPIMKDLMDCCEELAGEPGSDRESQGYREIALCLRSAAEGIHAPIWNSRSSMRIESDFVSFNTVDMEEDDRMKAAWYYNIMTWAWSEVRQAPQAGKPIRIVLDEAHNVVNPRYPVISDMVKSMVKRIRKRGGGTTIITQEVNDFLAPAIRAQGAAILNNATYKFIGQAEAQNLSEIAALYGMPPALVERVKKAKKGNFAFFAGTKDRTWLRVIVPQWMLDMFGRGGGQ